MRRNTQIIVWAPILALAATASVCTAQTPLTTERVAIGLARPVFVTAPIDDYDRLFIIEQHTGRIKILNLSTNQINPTFFIDLGGLSTGGEQGLLGLAFHPNYAANGRFFVRYSAPRAGNPAEPCNQPGFVVGCPQQFSVCLFVH